MAGDEKKFDLELGTSADTSGLEATERALRAVEEAGKDAANPMTDGSQLAVLNQRTEAIDHATAAIREHQAATDDATAATVKATDAAEDELEVQRRLDVERARGIKAQREQAEATRRIEENTRRLIAIGLASELSRLAGQYRGVNAELDLSIDMLDAMASGLATGNPFAALGAAALASAKSIFTARKEAAAYVEEGRKQAAASFEALQRAVEAQRIDRQKNFLSRFLSDGLADIDEAYQELLRLKQLAEATRSADAAEREATQRNALRSGADPLAVGRADLSADFAAELSALRAEAQASRDRADKLQAEADLLRADFAMKEADAKYNQAEIDEAKASADEAQKAADEAKAQATNAAELAFQKLREIDVERNRRVQELADEQATQMVAAAEKTVQVIESSGADLNAAQQDALNRTKQALADGTLTAQEQQQFITDFQGVLLTIRVNTEAQQEMMRTFIEITQGQLEATRELKGTADQLRRDMETLKQQLRTPGSF